MDPTMILAIAIVSLALVLVAVGIYSIMVLRDVREAIKQVNKILGRVDSMAEHVDLNVIRPGSSLAGLLGILRDGAHLVNEIRHISQDVSQTAKTVSSEVKEVSQVVKEDLIPAVSNGA